MRQVSLQLQKAVLTTVIISSAWIADTASAQQSPLDSLRAADSAAALVAPPGSPAFFRARDKRLKDTLTAIISAGREATIPVGPPNVNSDFRFRQNLVTMLNASVSGVRPRIFGGVPSNIQDVVELDGDGGSCTGTLITDKVVLTAGHCFCGGAVSKAFFGSDATKPQSGETINVARSIPKTPCATTAASRYIDPGNDFALVWLQSPSKAKATVIAQPGLVLHATDILAAGFGYTDSGVLGVKMQADIPVVSPNCTGMANGTPDAQYYGCAKGAELVAATLNRADPKRDTCLGDSGGPIYISKSGSLLVAGITSRGVETPGSAVCGDGGNYGLIGASIIKWINDNGVSPRIGQ